MTSVVIAEEDRPTRKLAHFFPLEPEERSVLRALAGRMRSVRSNIEIMAEGQPCPYVFLIQDGWLVRYKSLQDGRRQIVNFILPGDICDFGSLLFKKSAQTVTTITPVSLTEIEPSEAFDLFARLPRMAVALTWSAAQEASIFSEHLVNIGRRSALERLAHIILELQRRLSAVGLATESGFDFPLTQAMLADALGLTSVHVSRTMRRLRESGAVRLAGQTLNILDIHRLRAIAGFTPNFLHLDGAPPAMRAQLAAGA